MISLSPIHKSIRTTLYNKILAVSRNFTGKSLDAKYEMIGSEYTKAVWSRMFSPVDSTIKYIIDGEDAEGKPKYKKVSKKGMKTVSIFGGETDETNTIPAGFDSIYTPRTSTVDGKLEATDNLKRPIAGIKDMSVNYKGGLSAIREATINWTCWSFEDLARLTPHFMAHGKGVLIEWGYNIPEVMSKINFGKEDMVSGKAYSKIQDRIVELGGNYDAMAGVISNWEWSLRDDGGFDCTTTIVSRGVNILESDVSGTGTSPKTSEGEKDLTLPEFVKILRENITGLCAEGTGWFTHGPEKGFKPLKEAHKWKPGDAEQPPGTMYVKIDGWFSNPTGGPWVTWGFFEDNILSKFVGRFEQKRRKVINSFRSIEPVIDSIDGDGNKLYKTNGDGSSSNLSEAKFDSVKIKNSKWLLTPDMNRWILPGQFPSDHIDLNSEVIGEDLKSVVKKVNTAAKDVTRFLPFAIDPNDWDKGGYLRNILISYDLIEKSFEDANTVKEGMGNLFNEFNKDTDGFWNLEMVDDPYIPGNAKVIDANSSAFKPKNLLQKNIDARGKDGNDDFGNPESPMFVFPSWGENSIVKSQTLASKVPSSMAVSAMYAGTAPADREGENASFKAQAIAKLNGEGGMDESQKNVVMAGRIGPNKNKSEVFGSRSPYGHSEENWHLKSDGKEDTTIPSAEDGRGGFGPGHGVPFSEVTYSEYIQKTGEKLEADDPEKVKAEEKMQAMEADSDEADKNFHKLHPNGDREGITTSPSVDTVKPVSGVAWLFGGNDDETWTTYLPNGQLTEAPGFYVYMRRSMLDYLHGNGQVQTEKDRLKQSGEPMVPIELEIEIVGIGGIIPGNAFHVDYIPDQYKKYCVFQMLNVDHTISSDGWKTTIKGLPRVSLSELLKGE